MANFKVASSADDKSAAQLLETIRQENPRLWPYGLSMNHFGPGDLFLVQKQASNETVGFVGWQEKDLNGRRTGFYSIGLLPEYRGKGLAKAAVQQLIADRASGVEQIRALVADGNVSSEKLAEALGVPVLRKQAGPLLPLILKHPISAKILGALGTGAANAYVYDQTGMPHDPEKPFLEDRGRRGAALLNFGLGAMAGGTMTKARQFSRAQSHQAQLGAAFSKFKDPTNFWKGMVALDLGIAPVAKVFMAQNSNKIENENRNSQEANMLQRAALSLQEKALDAKNTVKGIPTWALLGGAGLLTGGVGYAAHRIAKAIKDKAEAPLNIQTNQGGRLKVTLPTKNPGDTETVIDVPFDQETAFSGALRSRLALDTRRRLYAETKQRVNHRIPRNIDQQITAGLPE